MAVKTSWSAGDVLTAADLTDTFAAKADTSTQGLTKITAQTITTASTVNVNNCFSSSYENYRAILNVTAVSNTLNVHIRMRASGTDSSASYNYASAQINASTGAVSGDAASAAAQWVVAGAQSGAQAYIVIDFIGPNLSSATKGAWHSLASSSSIYFPRSGGGLHDVASAYDGFSLITSANNMTGTLKVYGYKN